jgi:hypothetical protein
MNDQYGVCRLGIVPMRVEPAHRSEMVNQLLFGEHYTITELTDDGEWLRVRNYYDDYEGWIHSTQHHEISSEYFHQINNSNYKISLDPISSILYNRHPLFIPMGSILPISASELFKMEEQLAFNGDAKELGQKREYEFLRAIALKYLNSPYLWGGKTPFGMDCSGFTQQVFKISGYFLQRDSGQQFEQGLPVDVSETKPGDLAFFADPGKKKVSHVGMIIEDEKVIHCSGSVRIDNFIDSGIEHSDTKKITHELIGIKRILIEQ